MNSIKSETDFDNNRISGVRETISPDELMIIQSHVDYLCSGNIDISKLETNLLELAEFIQKMYKENPKLLFSFLNDDFLKIFLNLLQSNSEIVVQSSLRLLIYYTQCNHERSHILYQEDLTPIYLSLFNSGNIRTIKLVMILLVNNIHDHEQYCIKFLDFFNIPSQDVRLGSCCALYIRKELELIKQIPGFDFHNLILNLISYSQSNNPTTMEFVFSAIEVGLSEDIQPFRSMCIEERWWIMINEVLINSSLTRLRGLGYRMLRIMICFIPSEILSEGPLVPTNKIYFDMINLEENQRELLLFIQTYMEVFPYYIREFVEVKVDNEFTCIHQLVSVIHGKSTADGQIAAGLLAEVILKASGAQLKELLFGTTVDALVPFLEIVDDSHVADILSALHRLYISQKRFFAQEEILEVFESCETYDILNELISGEDESVVDLAKILLKDIYNEE